MRQRILLLFVLVTLLGSCTTMYKSGQTPDDVYYSPGREVPAYVENENNKDSRKYEEENFSDHYLRMKSANRNRWSAFDEDFMYWNNTAWNNPYYYNTMRPTYPYGGGSYWSVNVGFYNGFNPYYSSWYNPFCYPGYYGTPVVVVTNPKAYAPRGTGSLAAYTPRTSYSTDPKTGARTYNISGTRSFSNRSGGGSYYTPSSGRSTRTYSTDSYSNPSRSFNNSSNSGGTRSSGGSSSGGSRSSGGSSGGSAPVRSFPRGGG